MPNKHLPIMKIQTDPLSSTYKEKEETLGECPARMMDRMFISGLYLINLRELYKVLDVTWLRLYVVTMYSAIIQLSFFFTPHTVCKNRQKGSLNSNLWFHLRSKLGQHQ